MTLAADPETVGARLSGGWSKLSTSLGYLRDALVGRSFVGPIASGTERPHTDGLPGMLAGWKGSGGDAYREHLSDIGSGIEDLITSASNVSGALSRIEGDVRKAVASIPIPLGTTLASTSGACPTAEDSMALRTARVLQPSSPRCARTSEQPGFVRRGAFREKADGLEATMKVDGQANDNKRGGLWDTSSHLNNWYSDNQQVANNAAAPLSKAIEVEARDSSCRGPTTSPVTTNIDLELLRPITPPAAWMAAPLLAVPVAAPAPMAARVSA